MTIPRYGKLKEFEARKEGHSDINQVKRGYSYIF